MKKNNITTFIIVSGTIIVSIFTGFLSINMSPNNESDSYFGTIDEKMNAKIESLTIENNSLIIKTSGHAEEYCVKTTKTNPQSNALCFKKIQNNEATISVVKNKKYYIWIKDINGNISLPASINSK